MFMPISLEDFKQVEITVGKILSAEKVPETDKLLRLQVDFGNNTNYEPDTKVRTEDTPLSPPSKEGGEETLPTRDIRQIISGIAAYFSDPQVLVGKKCMFVTNIEPRVIKGLESNGMILAVSTDLPAEASAQAGDGKFSLLEPSAEIPEGTRAR